MPPKRKGKAKGKQTYRKPTASAHGRIFPTEVIFRILSRLPVKPLLRFGCVCRQWRTLISLPLFESEHLRRSPASTIIHAYKSPILIEDQTLAQFAGLELQPTGHVIYAYGAPIRTTHSTIDRILDFPGSDVVGFFDHLEVVGSSNGIFCVVQKPFSQRFTLWNPATRSSRLLPAPVLKPDQNIHRGVSVGFGFDSSRDEYKAIHIMCHNLNPDLLLPDVAEVFSLKTGHWKLINIKPGHANKFWVLRETCEAVIKGVPYWICTAYNPNLGKMGKMLVSFDVKKDDFKLYSYGWDTKGKEMCIGEIQDCLAVAVWERELGSHRGLDVWMKQNESGWSKIYQVEGLTVKGRVAGFYGDRGIVQEVGVEGNMIMYDLEKMEIEDLINVEDSLPFSLKTVSYRESFTRIPEIYRE